MLLRLIKETFFRRKRRVALAFLAVLLGASLVSALLTIYGDISGKMSRELRSFGANILVTPVSQSLQMEIGGISYSPPGERAFIDERDLPKIKTIFWKNNITGFAPFLSAVARVEGQPVVMTGTWFEKKIAIPELAPRQFETRLASTSTEKSFVSGVKIISPWWRLRGNWIEEGDMQSAIVGAAIAKKLNLATGDIFTIEYEGKPYTLKAAGIVSTGGFEENQIFVNLALAQKILAAPYAVDKVMTSALVTPTDKIAAGIKGKKPERMTPAEYELWYCTPLVESIAFQITEVVAGSAAGAIRQISGAESSFISKTELLFLLITWISLAASALGVMSTMTTMVMERRREIGLMKAIGAEGAQIASLFLLEAGVIGLSAGLFGYAAGLALAQLIGREVFGMPLSFSPVALPITLIVAAGVAIGGSAVPVKQAMNIEPVQLLRGI